ncbi:hypothetical protein BDI4_590058 [Burkholderia diffusa]|nr:hypothetical protein BDI4_590058 [Burkholderia diffusa]
MRISDLGLIEHDQLIYRTDFFAPVPSTVATPRQEVCVQNHRLGALSRNNPQQSQCQSS